MTEPVELWRHQIHAIGQQLIADSADWSIPLDELVRRVTDARDEALRIIALHVSP